MLKRFGMRAASARCAARTAVSSPGWMLAASQRGRSPKEARNRASSASSAGKGGAANLRSPGAVTSRAPSLASRAASASVRAWILAKAESIACKPGRALPAGKTLCRKPRVEQHQRNAPPSAGKDQVGPEFTFHETGKIRPPVRKKPFRPGRHVQRHKAVKETAGQTQFRNPALQQLGRGAGGGR